MIDFSQLDKFGRLLGRAERDFPRLIRRKKNEVGNRLLRYVKLKTPVAKENGGTARRGWQHKDEDTYTSIVYNNVEYIIHLEYGHRTRYGTSKYVKYRPNGSIKLVPGVFMLKRSIDEVQPMFMRAMAEVLDEFWKD